ncbi:hypothetical protein WJU16_21920 [Chitinophaga pollutisoli]|uniref:Uncharacterized protein n=1 Tax=Chitinophaga pollutisoli TaxID=3133966 RepID=A0ABZ2YM93_9BACT
MDKSAGFDTGGESVLPENLTIMISPELGKLFPTRGFVPYHVWIDENGQVRLRGIMENTHPEKIRQLLDGENIDFIVDHPSDIDFRKVSLQQQFPDSNTAQLPGDIFFSGFRKDLSEAWGVTLLNIKDTVQQTRRTTLINHSVDELYMKVYMNSLRSDKKVLFGKAILNEVKNRTKVSRDPAFTGVRQTDAVFQQTGYCYERIMPLTTPDSIMETNMLEDLNHLFRLKLNVAASVEERLTDGYRLIKTERIGTSLAHDDLHYEMQPIHFIFKQSLPEAYLSTIVPRGMLIVDDTGIAGNTTMAFPALDYEIKSMEELRMILRKYGLDLVPGKVRVKMLVIKDV